MLTASLVFCLVSWDRAPGTIASEPPPEPPASLRAPVPPPADFKIAIAFYGVHKEPITTAELIVYNGAAYYFASASPEEIVIVNNVNQRLELLDLERRVQTQLSFTKLDDKQEILHGSIAAAIRKQEEAGGRANRISAEMSRALNDPALAETFDPATSHLRLTNSAVTVEASGMPEPDGLRLAAISTALRTLTQLAAVRDPEAIPPFIRLDALRAMTAGHHLRPTELAYTYRLAGPPRKHRWTYHLLPTLTDRELEALNRVARLRINTPFIPFDRYERRGDAANANAKARTKTTQE